MRPLRLLVLGALALAAPTSRAQDPSAEPTYESVRLRAGFLPDPRVVAVTAGGANRVARGSCVYGHVADAPDVAFHYAGNGRAALYIYARSGADTTLLVRPPNQRWLCNDDGLGGRNPLLVIPRAASGLYAVWVGTYNTQMAAATLYISEIDPR